MKALVVIAHYFRAEPEARYSSTNESRRAARQHALQHVVAAWRAHAQEPATLNIERRCSVVTPGAVSQLDVAVLTHDDSHLLTDAMQQMLGVRKVVVMQLLNPRLLPFGAHRYMADRADQYDWFIYSEDDLLLHDPLLFAKLQLFQQAFGPRCVLQPHRYEINPRGTRFKTYIDGDLRRAFIDPLLQKVEAAPSLQQDVPGANVTFERTRNPHAGFFALSREQLAYWKAQPHFLDQDCSFVSPLESAATLGLIKTFGVYKAAAPWQGYCEIEHLDSKFSNLRLPQG